MSRALPFFLVALALACDGRASSGDVPGDQMIVTFDSATLRLVTGRDTIRLSVQLAVTPDQKTMGLMERRHLAADAGIAPGVPYRFALEVNSGYFQRHGITIGSVALLPNIPRPASLSVPRVER
jgi:hypothetical protein